jgi:hypothetical protein
MDYVFLLYFISIVSLIFLFIPFGFACSRFQTIFYGLLVINFIKPNYNHYLIRNKKNTNKKWLKNIIKKIKKNTNEKKWSEVAKKT